MAKKLKGILIEVNGGVVSYVEFNGKPATTYHLFDWDELLGEGDTRRAWKGLSTEEQKFIRDRYPTEFTAIQERLTRGKQKTTAKHSRASQENGGSINARYIHT